MFDEYVSLGNRCETAFQIQRITGESGLFPSFFNWNITYEKALINLLRFKFAGILEVDNLTPDEYLVYDQRWEYFFHLVGEGRKSKDHPNFFSDLTRHREKISYILDRLFALMQSGRKIAYFYRSEHENPLPYARELRDILLPLHHQPNFSIIFIQTSERSQLPWREDLLYNRYVKRLAPEDDQGDSHISSWDKIFVEFPLYRDMKLCYWI